MVSDYLVFIRDLFAVKGALIWALVVAPEPEGESRSRAQDLLSRLGVGVVLRVLGGCARAHPPDVAPEPMSELKTHPRAFMLDCSCCSLGMFCWGSRGHRGCNSRCGRRGKCR
jgi:hypothetical protein